MKGISLTIKMMLSGCLLLSGIIVQAQDDLKNVLQGKWVLEKVVVLENNEPRTVNVDFLNFEIPAEINVQQEEITFVRKENTEKLQLDVVAKGNILCIPVCAEWNRVKEKLQLRWLQDTESGGLTIVVTYSQK